MRVRVQKSDHDRYDWEVIGPKKLFGKRIRKRFKTKAEAERFKNDLERQRQEAEHDPIDPELVRVMARFQNKLTIDEIEEALLDKVHTVGKFNTTFADACSRHLKHLEQMHKRAACGADHVRDFRYAMPKIDTWLGNPQMKDIDKKLLDEFVDEQ